MSWFSIADIAKNALSEAQKKIDKALDIQAKEDVKDLNSAYTDISSTAVVDARRVVKPAEPKKVDLISKKKTRATKPGSSTFKAKKITGDISDDFFSVLDEEKYEKSSHCPERIINKSAFASVTASSVSLESTSEPLAEASSDDFVHNDTSKISQESTFTEVSLVVNVDDSLEQKRYTNNDKEKPSAMTFSDAQPEVAYHGGSSVNEEFINSTELKKKEKMESSKHELEACDDSINSTWIEKSDSGVASAPPQVERNVSPSVSTAASSEIDILDHESTVSEISSRCNEGQIFIQSPLHLRNIDAIDSDASQALSPIPNDVKNPERISPTSVIDIEPEPTQDQFQTFQPLQLVDSQEPEQGLTSELRLSNSAPTDTTNETHRGSSEQDVISGYNEAETLEINEEQANSINPLAGHSFQPIQLAETHQGLSEEPTQSKGGLKTSNTSDENSHAVTSSVDISNDKYIALSEKMKVYEQQLMTLSHKNAQLNEENDNLRSEIARTREQCQKEAAKDVEEISESLKSYESNNKVLKDEKANLMKQMAVLKSKLASRMTNEQVQTAIGEKEDSIKGLMEEGEVLSKKLLQQNNLIKKLKSQVQERETELKTLRDKVSAYETENTKLKQELEVAQGRGQEERETSLRISDAYEQRERETQILQEKLSQSEEKQRTLQVNLDAAYKEIGDLHKQLAEQESKTLTEWKVKETELMRESDIEKKKIASDQEHQKQLLMLQIMELNNSVSRAEAAAARKDDDHRREIKELQQRLQESEGRNQDLSDNVSSATRPLLRQIENLQATHASQQRSWNALEKTLNSRLGDAQAELHAARENERVAQNTSMEAKSKAAAYEKHIENNKKTIAAQANEIECLGRQVSEYKSQTKLLSEELEESKSTHKESVHKSRKERLFLENQLQMEKVRSEAERKKYAAQQEALQKEKDRMMWSRSEITSVSSNQIIETESVGSAEAFHSTDAFEKQLSYSSLPGLTNQLSFEGGRSMSISNALENLQTQLKLRDGEIAQLRGDINTLERTRSSMAEEIVRLTNLNEDLDGVSKELQDIKEKLAEVEGRYSAILTMYGEKEEENEELRMDLADVKAMYRQQINDLLRGEPS